MSSTRRPIVPEGSDHFTDEEFLSATDRVQSARDAALADPDFARLVEAKTAEIGRRVHTLASLRKARGLTQHQLTEELGMTQGEVSRLERRENLHLATLARFIEATGGMLRITAVYDDDEVDVGLGSLTGSEAISD